MAEKFVPMLMGVRDPETGHKVPRLRPESEWIVTTNETLRIIPQALWDRVQQRRKASSNKSL